MIGFNFQKFIKSDSGRFIVSVILGFGLASLFKKVCKGKGCYRFVAPEMVKIDNKIYSFDDKCYTYKPKAVGCNVQKKKIHFTDSSLEDDGSNVPTSTSGLSLFPFGNN